MTTDTWADGRKRELKRTVLSEELPLFCDGCGYSLHGQQQIVCSECGLRHFHCPECGKRQSINTWRPAAFRTFGRLRMMGLWIVVIIKLALMATMVMVTIALASDLSRSLREPFLGQFNRSSFYYSIRSPNVAQTVVMIVVAALVAATARMLFLRFRSGFLVGVAFAMVILGCFLVGGTERVLINLTSTFVVWVVQQLLLILVAALISVLFMWLGGVARRKALSVYGALLFIGVSLTSAWQVWMGPRNMPMVYLEYMFCLQAGVIVGATIAWPMWCGLVKGLLPAWASSKLLAWQRSASEPALVGGVGTEIGPDPSAVHLKTN